ncbi:MAG TPA: ribosome maturation factor RimM [Actinomycetota bacterium]
MEPERLAVGRVAKAHGIRGEVSVEVYSDAPERFAPGRTVIAGTERLSVAAAREHQGRLLVKFEQVPDRTAAEALRGTTLFIEQGEARPLQEWSFYPHEIEGFLVVDRAGRALGALARVQEGAGHDHWVIARDGGEVLVPAVRAIVVGVDRDARRITLDPPEGLF